MPIYEYECPKCGKFEVIQKASDKPLKANPECERKDCPGSAKRLMSSSALKFVGSGFYKTDYCGASGGKSGGKSNGAGSTSGNSSSSESSGSPASESGTSSASSDSSSAGDATAKKKGCGSGCGCA